MNPLKSIRQAACRSQAFLKAWIFQNPASRLGRDLARLEANRVDCAWLTDYGFVSSLCQSLPARQMVEIGVAYGYHAEQILESCPRLRYVGVDPFLAGYDPKDSLSADVQHLFGDSPEASMSRLHQSVSAKLAAKFLGRATLWRMKSHEAASVFKDQIFDLVYVDGDHTFEGVSGDLSAWISKIRPGGIFCGDDYDWEPVRQAVEKFAAERGLCLSPCPRKKWMFRIPS